MSRSTSRSSSPTASLTRSPRDGQHAEQCREVQSTQPTGRRETRCLRHNRNDLVVGVDVRPRPSRLRWESALQAGFQYAGQCREATSRSPVQNSNRRDQVALPADPNRCFHRRKQFDSDPRRALGVSERCKLTQFAFACGQLRTETASDSEIVFETILQLTSSDPLRAEAKVARQNATLRCRIWRKSLSSCASDAAEGLRSHRAMPLCQADRPQGCAGAHRNRHSCRAASSRSSRTPDEEHTVDKHVRP